MDNIRDEIEIADIVAKKLLKENELSEEEEQQLRRWLEESREHEELFQQVVGGQSLAEFREIIRLSDPGDQWQRLDRLTREKKSIGWRRWLAYVAGVALLLSLGLWFGLKQMKEDKNVVRMAVIESGKMRALLLLDDGRKIALQERDTLVTTASSNINIQMGQVVYEMKDDVQETVVEYNTIVVPRGGIYSLVLSDGTKVFLNSESELRYPAKFAGGNRNVYLKGEAFFEVTPDSLRPFIVNAREMQTRVLGTSFNILAYADEPAIRTTLFTGRVEVSVNDTPLKEVLLPGMQASWEIGSDNIGVKKVNMDIQSLWRDGIIMLDDDRLESVMRMLARWYNVTYEWKGDRNARHTFTGKINRNEDLGSVLSTLTLLGGPRFEIVGTTVYIY
ncbi:FecR family protein [Butyricimonas synergistica]|uniref:FecR family protein n=1 Tax=Butyricimonas synergistica TaxID=544644 RepID=UPI00037754C8|nr:FecR family protein [Butyricimonas synergistica]